MPAAWSTSTSAGPGSAGALRLPVVRPFLQLVADASGAGPRPAAASRGGNPAAPQAL